MHSQAGPRLAIVINVDWYFLLHWSARTLAAKREGYDVYVFTRLTSSATKKQIEEMGVVVVDLPISRHGINPVSELGLSFKMGALLRRYAIDFVHAITIKPIIYMSILRCYRRCPAILSFPGLGALMSDRNFLKRLFWCVLRVCLRARSLGDDVCAIFENAEDQASLAEKGIHFSQARVIPGAGVDPNHFVPLDRGPSDVVRVLFAARLLKSKGLESLVSAVEDLLESGCKVELHVAGILDEDHSDALSASDLNRISLRPGVIWHGRVGGMAELIGNVDVVCLPTSYGEGIPRVLIEGAACGKPLVATNVPGCREIVVNGLNGYLVTSGSHSELVDVLRRLASNAEERALFGRRGRELVEHVFTNHRIVSQTLEVYASVGCKCA